MVDARVGSVLFAFGLLLSMAGCNGESPASEERVASRQRQSAAPGTQTGIDTLFQAYDRAFLQAPRYDSTQAWRWVDSTLAALSTKEKIGQLFVVEMPDPAASGEAAMQALKQYGVGGFLVPRLLPPKKMFQETRRLQQAADVPLFMAADYERGVGRFSNPMTELSSNMGLGATREEGFAAASGRLTAIESRAVGVNLLFAPVVDVNNNPDNPIINIRSYGGKPALVGRMAEAYVREAERYGALTTLKHFPGHGNVSTDTHAEMGAVTGSRAELDSVELAPYRMVLSQPQQPAAVMTAHLWVQALDEEPLPATFSSNVLQGVLRDELGFDGMVVTDDVTMGALHNDYSLAERVTRPLEAGADVILTPEQLAPAIEAVQQALQRESFSEEQLNQSVRRILEAKAGAGLHKRPLAGRKVFDYLIEEPRGQKIAQTIADEALTLLKTAPVLPLTAGQRVALVQLSNYRGSESIGAAMDALRDTLANAYAMQARYDEEPSASERTQVLKQAAAADVVVLALYLRLRQGRGEAGLFPAQRTLVRRLLAQDVPVVLAAFGNPYAVSTFPAADAALVAYDQTLASVYAASGVLKGNQLPQGQLPITVAPYDFGAGLSRLHPAEAATAEAP